MFLLLLCCYCVISVLLCHCVVIGVFSLLLCCCYCVVVLLQLGLDDSRLHRINGVLVLLSFLLCRVLLFPFMYRAYGRQVGLPLHQVALHLPLQCTLGNLAILAPQLYWFSLLLRKAKRLYLRQKRGTRDGGRDRERDGERERGGDGLKTD